MANESQGEEPAGADHMDAKSKLERPEEMAVDEELVAAFNYRLGLKLDIEDVSAILHTLTDVIDERVFAGTKEEE
jgi:hypothetical protein